MIWTNFHNHMITGPWWFTDKLIRRYLSLAVPYLKGRLLDAGCGCRPYKDILMCEEYVSLDVSDNFSPDVVGDLKNMKMFKPEEFDSILNNQVLEHVDKFDRVLEEFHRVLKPGGYLCITVPFIARLHGVPHDYWRFSEFGIRSLFKKHDFNCIFIKPMGGFFTTQCYLWSFYIYERCLRYRATRLFYKILMPFLNPLALLIHKLDRDKSTPFNYIAVARKHQKSLESNCK